MSSPPSSSSASRPGASRPSPSHSSPGHSSAPQHPGSSGVSGSGVHRAPAEPRRGFLTGLLARTTVTMLLVSLVPIALFGAVSLYQQSERLRVEAEASLRTSGARIANEVDEWFDKSVRIAEASAMLPAVTGMRGEDQTPVLVAISRAYPWVYLAHILGADGKDISRSDGRPMVDYSDRGYYKTLMSGQKGPVWETLIGKTSQKPAVMLCVPIVNAQKVVGVLVLAMNVEDLSKIFAHWRTGQTGFAFLTDDQSKVMAHPREEYVKGMVRLAEHPLVAAFRKDGQPHLLSFAQSDAGEALGYVQGSKWGWAVAIQRERSELYAPLRQTVYLGAGLLALVALLVAIAARAASRMLVRPIVDMSKAADRMSMGHLEDPVPSMSIDELAMLARSLDRLRISLRAAMARLRG